MKITKAARQTFAEINRIAEWESDRGADASDVIKTMLEHNLFFDGEDQRKYMNIKVFDVEGAKELFIQDNKIWDEIRAEEDKDEPDYDKIKRLEKEFAKICRGEEV